MGCRMTCTRCRGRLTTRRSDVDFDVSGLRVKLRGVKLRVCASCGEREVVVPNVEGLHRVVHDLERKAGRPLHLDLRMRRGEWDSTAAA